MRVDSAALISGALVCGNRGLGVIGSLIPATGDNGAGYAYNDLDLPADNDKEICGRITAWPSDGILTAYEDTSFEFSGAADGDYTFQYQLYVDGVATGSPSTVTLSVGAVSTAAAQVAANLDDAVFSGGAIPLVNATFALTTDSAVFAGSAVVAGAPNEVSITVTLDDAEFSGSASCLAMASFTAYADDAVFAGSATVSSGFTGSLSDADIARIASAVWAHSSAAMMITRLSEAWGRLGLDPAKPLITGDTQITFGEIVMAMAQSGNEVTVTRQ